MLSTSRTKEHIQVIFWICRSGYQPKR